MCIKKDNPSQTLNSETILIFTFCMVLRIARISAFSYLIITYSICDAVIMFPISPALVQVQYLGRILPRLAVLLLNNSNVRFVVLFLRTFIASSKYYLITSLYQCYYQLLNFRIRFRKSESLSQRIPFDSEYLYDLQKQFFYFKRETDVNCCCYNHAQFYGPIMMNNQETGRAAKI